jgi:cation transport ATPase
MLKNIPRSACSRDWIEKERAQAACAREVVVMMVPALCLLTLLLTLCIHEIVNFPENTRITGWFVLVAIVTVIVWMSWSFVDHQFQKSIRQRVLTAVPLKEPGEEEHQHDEEQRQVKVQQASNSIPIC